MANDRVILVRHARPVIDSKTDAQSWEMDASARKGVEGLAGLLVSHDCDVVVTSEESKARETGRIIGKVLDVPVHADVELGEQGAGTVPWIASESAFRARVIEHFELPVERVFGEESSCEAGARFAEAAARGIAAYRCPVLVTHGRVMSAYVSRITDTDPVEFWLGLRMPDAFILDPGVGRWWRIDKEG